MKTAVEEKPALQPKQHLLSKQHPSKKGRRVTIFIAAASVLTIAYLAWKYVWPFLK